MKNQRIADCGLRIAQNEGILNAEHRILNLAVYFLSAAKHLLQTPQKKSHLPLHPLSAPRSPLAARRSPLAAFTLIEILIAIGIVATAFIPILNMYTGSMRDSMRLSDYAYARELAAKTMDELLAMEYEALPVGSNLLRADGYEIPRTETKKSTTFQISMQITERKPEFKVRHVNLAGFIGPPQTIRSPDNELKNIQVTVTWQGVGSAQNFSLHALKADLFR